MSDPSETYEPAWEFRMLYHDMMSYEGTDLYVDLLAPWLRKNGEAREWLLDFAQRQGSPVPPASLEELHALYAANRVNDILLGSFQPATEPQLPELFITLDQYVAFMTSLGFEITEATIFSPFYHEIVEVIPQMEDDAPVEVTGSFWPCLMLGNMLFSRSGVKVRSGSRWLRPELATSTTLYWTYRRRCRPYQDLSQGWGSNSQWRTNFRRDYRFGRDIYFNVDEQRDVTYVDPPGNDPCTLTLEERIELVTHRCFVTLPTAHEDLFPYWYSLRLSEETR